MPAYNFQARFAELVRKRIKRQTIRARRKDGRVPKVGERLVAYTGMRTKKCSRLSEGVISAVLPVKISFSGIVLDGRTLTPGEANSIAMLDGFQHANEMVGWFIDTHGHNFEGHLIQWV